MQLAFVSMAHSSEDIEHTIKMATEVFKVIPVDADGPVARTMP